MTATNRARAKKPRTWERWAVWYHRGRFAVLDIPGRDAGYQPTVYEGGELIRVKITELKPRGRRKE